MKSLYYYARAATKQLRQVQRGLAFARHQHQPWQLPFDELAHEEDIYACFRLLLGRQPQGHEWIGHRAHADRPLRDVVAEPC